MSTYKFAGVSRNKGALKVRFANDMTRVKVLAKNGHTEVDLIELKEAMTKQDAVAFLLSIDFATKNGKTNQEVHDALLAEVDRRQEKAVKAPKQPKPAKAPKTPKAKPTLESIAAKKPAAPKSTVSRKEIEAQLDAMEDAPF